MPCSRKNAGVAPVGATPSALIPYTFCVLGLYMRACVSPPQLSTSHIVAVAPSMAHAASTALPPFWNIIAPAVAAKGLPVIATQWRPWSTGLTVRCASTPDGNRSTAASKLRLPCPASIGRPERIVPPR